MSDLSDLEVALKFIEKIEQENLGKSTYEIVNRLRGYTKPAYTSRMWTTATGYKQDYVEGELKGKLNQDLLLCDQVTDFGHFIASLSDQVNQPGVQWSDLTSWTGDHTAWAGDIGSAIATFRAQPPTRLTIPTLKEALNRYARDSDYAADIAAYGVGLMLNTGVKPAISEAIAQYDRIPHRQNVRLFIQKRLEGAIVDDQLQNPGEVEAEIRRAVSTYIRLSPDSYLFKSVKDLLKLQPKLELDNSLAPSSADLLQGSLHFLHYLQKQAALKPFSFKPYQMPKLPWLGTVNYTVTISAPLA